MPQRRVSAETRYVLRRVGGALLVIVGAVTLAFFALVLVPGDPVDIMLGPAASTSQEARAAVRADLGLDQPVVTRYFAYVGRVLMGDLGTSYQLGLPVTTVIGQQAGATLQLAAIAMLFAIVFALIGALLLRGRTARRITALTESVAVSAPTFWVGLLLLGLFAVQLGWFPVAGSAGPAALVLPALTLAIPLGGIIGTVLRSSLDDAEEQPFAVAATARGSSSGRFIRVHGLRHGAVGTLTLIAYLIGGLLAGTVVVENIFSRQGLGRVALKAITDRDLPVVLGLVILSAVIFAVINLVVDLILRRLDPRRRLAEVSS